MDSRLMVKTLFDSFKVVVFTAFVVGVTLAVAAIFGLPALWRLIRPYVAQMVS